MAEYINKQLLLEKVKAINSVFAVPLIIREIENAQVEDVIGASRMRWIYEKFIGSLDIYEICPKCNFNHSLNETNISEDYKVTKGYNYCPLCGEHLRNSDEPVKVVWNERDISCLHISKG